MLGKLLIFAFTFLGIFALIMATLPSDFITASFIYDPSYRSATVEDAFEANNMIVYENSNEDNMTYEYRSIYDAPSPPQWSMGLPAEDYVDVMWVSAWWAGGVPAIGIRLEHRHWFLSWYWFTVSEESTFYSTDGARIGGLLELVDLEAAWNEETNASAFVMKMPSISSNFIVHRYDVTKTLETNWNEGTLAYYITYNANFTAMAPSAFTIVGNLLSFQAPSLGVSGAWGSFLNSMIAIPIWSCIAYIVYKIIAGLIPWVSGGSGD